MYICVCKAVTDSQIIMAIEQGLCSRKKLTHCFGIGRDCGKCNQEVNALLMQSAEKRPATHEVLNRYASNAA